MRGKEGGVGGRAPLRRTAKSRTMCGDKEELTKKGASEGVLREGQLYFGISISSELQEQKKNSNGAGAGGGIGKARTREMSIGEKAESSRGGERRPWLTACISKELPG